MEKITARTNEKIKYAVKLGESPSFRRKNGEFILEGARLCSDAAKSGTEIRSAFITSKAFSKYESYVSEIIAGGCICYEISEDIAKKLSDTENPQGVFCICAIPADRGSEIRPDGRYLALENLQDPSNLGAISRSVEALGLDGLIVSGGCDIYNPKAQRAAMGSLLRLNVIEAPDLEDIIKKADASGILTLASVPRSSAQDIRTVEMKSGVICCVGNEGNGLSQAVIGACRVQTVIPMQGRAESFNASAAAAILAWELKR